MMRSISLLSNWITSKYWLIDSKQLDLHLMPSWLAMLTPATKSITLASFYVFGILHACMREECQKFWPSLPSLVSSSHKNRRDLNQCV